MANNEGCELCSKPARMFCESDQARLCWDCDEKVHAANFLVAKHCRTLLCHACASPTPWKAAGLKLGPAVAVCLACAEGEPRGGDGGSGCGFGSGSRDCDSQESESDDGEYYSDGDGDEDADEDEDGEEEEEEDGENQVVPWSICNSEAPPSPVAPESSSSTEDDASFSLWKRTLDCDNPLESENEEGICSSHNLDSKLASPDLSIQESENLDSSEQILFRPLKRRRTNNGAASIPPERAGSGQIPANSQATIVRKVLKFQQEIMAEGGDTSSIILGICKLSREH